MNLRLIIKLKKIQSLINPTDDLKSAAGEIYIGLNRLLNLTGIGNSKEAFLRDSISFLVSEDTEVFALLENDIFN